MYPEIAPSLKLAQTVSHPLQPDKVVGFLGRNQVLGRTALVMKEEIINDDISDDQFLPVPGDVVENLDSPSEIVFLIGDRVLAMDSSDFAMQAVGRTYEGEGSDVEMPMVRLDNEIVQEFSENEVEISN